MNKPLIRTLMIACAASMTLPAQGVMVARKKKQDPKPAATAPKADTKAEVDVKALHEKLMKALAEADLSDAERAKVMETIGKALHKAHGDAAEVHRVRAVDVVGEPLEGEARVFVVGGDGEGGKKIVRVMGSDEATIHSRIKVGDEVLDLREIKERAKAGAKAPTAESRAVWGEKAAEGEKQYRINVVGKGTGEAHEVILEEVCEEACEEGEAPKTKVIRRVIHGEPMKIEMGEIEIAEPMILELENLELKIDEQHKAVDIQRKKADVMRMKADEMRARAEKLRAAVGTVDPAQAQDVRVYVGDLAKAVEMTPGVQIEVERLHDAIAKAHKDGHTYFSVSRGDAPAQLEWVGEAPKAKTKDKAKAKSKAKAGKSDGDMAEAIRELREEMRELRQMMKQIRKEMRDEDEQAPAPLAPLAPTDEPAPAALPARVSMTMPVVPPAAPLAPVATTFGGFPAVVAPAPAAAPVPDSASTFGGIPAVAPVRARSVRAVPTAEVAPSRQLK